MPKTASLSRMTLKKKQTTPKKSLKAKAPIKKNVKKSTAQKEQLNKIEAVKTLERMAVNEAGIIIRASGIWEKLEGQKLEQILKFKDSEEAVHDRPNFGFAEKKAAEDLWVASIVEGEHETELAGENIKLSFEHTKYGAGQSILLISTTSSAPTKIKKTEKFNLQKFIDEKTGSAITQNNSKKQSELENHAAIFAQMTHDLMLLMDYEGKVLAMNDTFRYTFDYGLDDIADFTFMDLVHPDDRAHVRPTFKSLLQGDGKRGDVIAFECRVMAQDQSIHWLEWRLKKQNDFIYAICRDLTYIKESEERNLRQQQQLSEAQRLGRMGHWMWRVGDQAIQFSDEIYRIFGVTREEFTPTIDSVNAMLHRRDVGRMAQGFQRAMIEQKNFDMEFRIMRKNGTARFIQLQGKCEMDAEGEITALFGIMQDVTERTQHERELREAKEAAERAYAAKSQFLANMSHELRTPLNAIIGFSEMMQRQLLGPIGTEKYLDYIGGIRESGEHLLDLISDILDMSKIEAGKYQLDVEQFNIMKVLRLASHMIEGRALDAQVKILSTIPEDLDIDMQGDRRAVMQVVLNILSNAVKFTEPGGEVRIAADYNDAEMKVTIEDTGIGIPPSKLKYVTEPFEQAANHFTRNHEGSGLGLAITKELIELHGGTLTIQSQVGVGTRVTFTLPKDCKKKLH